jgi:hypothetical protein
MPDDKPKAECPHQRAERLRRRPEDAQPPTGGCNQCRIEDLPTEQLLAEVGEYEASLRAHGIVPRGWWPELRRRLAGRSELQG